VTDSACPQGPVAAALHELPTTALESLLDLAVQQGATAVVMALLSEFGHRHPDQLLP
jgi:hypothetical protein